MNALKPMQTPIDWATDGANVCVMNPDADVAALAAAVLARAEHLRHLVHTVSLMGLTGAAIEPHAIAAIFEPTAADLATLAGELRARVGQTPPAPS